MSTSAEHNLTKIKGNTSTAEVDQALLSSTVLELPHLLYRLQSRVI